MNIVCVICSDLLVPSSDVFHTPCGHIFHYGCLLQWLERSRTCPQCRERTTEHKIHRIYFNFSNNDNIVEDATSLQNQLDNMIFQLKLRDNEITDLKSTKKKLEKQTSGLRQEVKNVESQLHGKDSAIHSFQTQIKFYKQQCAEIDEYKTDNKRLKEKVEHLQNIQILLESSASEVDEMIAMTLDHTKLITYIGVLKREMLTNFNKRRKLEHKMKDLELELMKIKKEYKVLEHEHIKRKELEKQLNICETEKISLQTQLLDKQANVHCVCNKASVENQNNSKGHDLKESNDKNKCLKKLEKNTSDLEVNNSCIIVESDNKNTPQNMKSGGFFSLQDHGNRAVKRTHTNVKIPSILAKKSKFSQPNQKTVSNNGMSFDGFGGHAKLDRFPNPKIDCFIGSSSTSFEKKNKIETKRKKIELDTGDNRKLSNIFVLD